MSLDPASLQVLIARLTGITDEMGAVLQRAAFSANIKERVDASAALFTPSGDLLVQAEHIPVHLGSMPAAVRVAIEALGAEVGPGDQIVLNDPFRGGTHLNDVTVVAPSFVGGRLVGWSANRAHHADLGGGAPGSMPAHATEIFHEGLRLPPVLLDDGVRALFAANSRTPEERRGDLDAQAGANRLGARRLAEIADGSFDDVLDYGERRMRAALAALPDGRWSFRDTMDSLGASAELQHSASIEVSVTVSGDSLVVDFDGTDPQAAGNVNAVEAVTISAVTYALRTVVESGLPANGGAMRPVEIRVPRATLVGAVAPAAVGAGNVEVSQRVADVCLGAFAQMVPDRVGAASQGTMNNVLIGGRGWVYYETVGGGQGARPGRDGMSGVHTAMTNTRNTPIEALERAFPLRVRVYGLRVGSGGAGSACGGDGIDREVEVLDECTLSLITERRVSQPWGLAGGEPGAVGENWLLPGGDESRAERLPDKCTVDLVAGDVVRMLTPGGGGWGDPAWATAGTEAGPPRD